MPTPKSVMQEYLHPKLKPVDPSSIDDLHYLWMVLQRRLDETGFNISHQKMPEWSFHVQFVRGIPYARHDIITVGGGYVGVCYLSFQNEIGIWIAPENRREGIAERSLRQLMSDSKGPWLANINPANLPSQKLFGKLGFTLLHTQSNQITMVKEAAGDRPTQTNEKEGTTT